MSAGGVGRIMTRRRHRAAAETGGGGGIMTRGRKRTAAAERGERGSPTASSSPMPTSETTCASPSPMPTSETTCASPSPMPTSETTCAWLPKSNYRQLQCLRTGDGLDFQWLEPSPSRDVTLPPDHPPKPIGLKALPPLTSNPNSWISEQKSIYNVPGLVKTETVFVPMDTVPLIDPTVIAAKSGAEVRVRVAVELQGTISQIANARFLIKDVVREFDNPVLDFSRTSGKGWVYKTGSFPTKVVCMSQVASSGELIQDEYCEDTVKNEGEKYGKLSKVIIPRPGPKGELGPGVGKVFLEYEDVVGSCKARLALDGLKFGERQIVAIFYPENKFARGEYND